MANDDAIFNQLDQEKITQAAADKASQTALEEVKRVQQDLIERISGGKKKYSWEERGETKPQSYDELFDEVKKQTPTLTQEEIDRRVEEKLQEKEQEKQKLEEENRKKEAETILEKRKEFDQEWYDLVQQKKMPEPSKEIQEKINKGEKLTMEEIQADEGLSARIKLAQLAQSTNKSAKLAFYEDWDKQSPGANAPVLGGRPPVAHGNDEELKYEDVQKERKRLFGW